MTFRDFIYMIAGFGFLVIAGCAGMTPQQEAIQASGVRSATTAYILSAKTEVGQEARAARIVAFVKDYRQAVVDLQAGGDVTVKLLVDKGGEMVDALGLADRDQKLAKALIQEVAFLYVDMTGGIELPKERLEALEKIIFQVERVAQLYFNED